MYYFYNYKKEERYFSFGEKTDPHKRGNQWETPGCNLPAMIHYLKCKKTDT